MITHSYDTVVGFVESQAIQDVFFLFIWRIQFARKKAVSKVKRNPKLYTEIQRGNNNNKLATKLEDPFIVQNAHHKTKFCIPNNENRELILPSEEPASSQWQL